MISGFSDTNRCLVVAVSGAIEINNLEAQFASPNMQARIGGFSRVDSSGAYELTGLEAGDYTIVFFQLGPNGYEGATFGSGQVTVGASGTVDLNLTLR